MRDDHRDGAISPRLPMPDPDPEIPPTPSFPIPLERESGQTRQAVCVRERSMPPHTHHEDNEEDFDHQYSTSGQTKEARWFLFAAEDASNHIYRGFSVADLGSASDTKVRAKAGTITSSYVDIDDGADLFDITSVTVTVSPTNDGDTLKLKVIWSPSNSGSDQYIVAMPLDVRSDTAWSFVDYVRQGVIATMPSGTNKTIVIPDANASTDYAVFLVKSTTNLIVSSTTPEYYSDMEPVVISDVVIKNSAG